MVIPRRDSNKMKNLVREGKQITKITSEDFPEYDYWDIYSEVYGSGEQSALGVKRMITYRLNQLLSANVQTRQSIVDEINDLIWYLYDNYKSSQKKLDNIRSILSE